MISRGSEKGRLKSDVHWYKYIYPKNLILFQREKIVGPEISLGGNFAYDEKGEYYSTTTIYGYIKKSSTKESYQSLLALLNSKLFWWYLLNTGTVLANGYFRYKPDYVKPFPVPSIINPKSQNELEVLVNKRMRMINKSDIGCKALETEINKIIYNLYELTLEEINWIEQTSSL